ncbi:MAG: (5-formylfuran-3-yl)methyl phosphate synthase [Phycisphaeraceae bacterium]
MLTHSPHPRPASPDRPGLLVSVRNVAEARAAMAGGADVIDIKEPAAGALGAASPTTIQQVAAAATSTHCVSAALGELVDGPPPTLLSAPAVRGLDFVKVGLGGAPANWRARLDALARQVGAARFVVAVYADAEHVGAPPLEAALAWMTRRAARPRDAIAGLLIDTAIKDGRGLRTWVDDATLARAIGRAHAAGAFVALAGSLRADDLPHCASLGPDLLAVRGAACRHGDRRGTIRADLVRHLKQTITTAHRATHTRLTPLPQRASDTSSPASRAS